MKYYLYLIKDKSENYKIGITGDIKKRFKTINSYNPTAKIMFYQTYIGGENIGSLHNLAKKDEELLHVKFNKKRTKGEWFKLNKKDIVKIFKIFGWGWQPRTGKFIGYKEALEIFDAGLEEDIIYK